MPKSLIEVRRSYSPAEEAALLDAVHESLVAAFRIPPEDRGVRLMVHAPDRFAVSPVLSQPDRATLVTIDCFAGRSLEAKRRLYSGIAERFEALGIPRDHVSVILHEITRENWGTRGQAASDVDLGFTVEV
jgi:phenylpyruvate tautomerase PptA (4-oxalocrotonate tautomerase family)